MFTDRSPRWTTRTAAKTFPRTVSPVTCLICRQSSRPVQRRLVSCQVRVPNLPLPDLLASAPGSRTLYGPICLDTSIRLDVEYEAKQVTDCRRDRSRVGTQ